MYKFYRLILLLCAGVLLSSSAASRDFPVAFDLRDYNGNNYVTGVRMQYGGTCWTHGTMASIEGNLLMTGNWAAAGETGEPNMAEYHLDWWNGFNEFNNDDTDPPTGGGLVVHEGGDYLMTAAYLSRGEGAVRDIDAQWFDIPPARWDSGYHYYYVRDIEWYVAEYDLSNIGLIKQKLMDYGVIGTALALGYDEDDIYWQDTADAEDPVHAVAIVGWDDTLSTPAPLPGAWLCKNSWGENWAYGGYFWISYYDKWCGQHPEMGAVSFQNVEPMQYDRVYYHDYHGWRDTKSETSEAFNAFTAVVGEIAEVLRAVSFYTAADSVDFTIKIYDNFTGSELQDELISQSGYIEFHGFHTIDLESSINLLSGDDFYVYVTLSDGGHAFDRTSDIPVLLGADYRTMVESYSEPGQSYYKLDDQWKDLYTVDTTANFCIKALTTAELYLGMSLESDIPVSIDPGAEYYISLTIVDDYENYLAGSGKMHYRFDGGDFIEIPLTPLGGDLYQATLPAAECSDKPEFYFSAATDGGHTVMLFYDLPTTCFSTYVGIKTLMLDDDFETDMGWTISGNVTSGMWERTVPSGGGGSGDPGVDYDGSGSCYVTENGYFNTDVDNGYAYLTSPALDLSNGNPAVIEFAVWYANMMGTSPNNDIFKIYLSADNGGDWVLLDSIGPATSRGWIPYNIMVNDIIPPTSQMRVRFEVSDLGMDSEVEAGVDAFKAYKYHCISDIQIVTEQLPDWTVGVPYSQQLVNSGGAPPVVWSDLYGDLTGSGLSLDQEGLLSGTPLSATTVAFTAHVIDDSTQTDEREFNFEINPELQITTGAIPDMATGEECSMQLESSGGTAEIVWSDRDNALEGTGLSLTAAGLLAGTPPDTCSVSLVVRVEDQAGATDEQTFAFCVALAYVCGDANGDGGVNLLDITFIINYLYKEGAAPEPMEAADADGNLAVNLLDITYLINYLYKDGPDPLCE